MKIKEYNQFHFKNINFGNLYNQLIFYGLGMTKKIILKITYN